MAHKPADHNDAAGLTLRRRLASIPVRSGVGLVFEAKSPETPVAVLSARDDADEAASKAGADGAISKETPLPDIISSLGRLAR